MKPLRIAVIGCGKIATDAHIPAYTKNPDAEIACFCDIIPERAREKADACGGGAVVTDYRAALADPSIDAISICTPNDLHARIAIDAMRAGKHVLCEKPAARTYDEAVEMAAVQKETGMTLNIGVCNRFNDAVNHIKETIDRGELGEVYHVYGSFRSHRSIPGLGGPYTTKAISGGGVLIDWGVHFLDLIMYCAGDPKPLTVSGNAYSKMAGEGRDYTYTSMWAGPPIEGGVYDVEDFIAGFIRTEGPTISIQGAWAQNIGENEMYIDFLGDRAGIRLMYGANFKVYSFGHGMLTETAPAFPVSNMYENEIGAFLRCIRSGEKLPSHIDFVLPTAKIMQGLYDSAASGREVSC